MLKIMAFNIKCIQKFIQPIFKEYMRKTDTEIQAKNDVPGEQIF